MRRAGNPMEATRALRYVDTPAALDALSADLAGHDWLALDTEFIREDTYYPRLCLIQVAAPGVTACVDTLALPRPEALLARIHDPAVTKIFHASHQDMEIFYHLCGGRLPSPVFDTQIAAALLGLPAQASYASLVAELLGVALDKAHARTDWSRRPLSREQIEYAADDVRWLGPLHLELRTRLEASGRLEWLREDCATMCDPARYANPPEAAWTRVRGARYLNETQLRVLQALAAWRETAARAEDRPRGWLLRDDALLDIARIGPGDREQLEAIRSVPLKAAARYGAILLDLVRATGGAAGAAGAAGATGATGADDGGPAPSTDAGAERLTDSEKTLLKRMTERVRHSAAGLSIEPAVIASRRDLLELLHDGASPAWLDGWRRDVVGNELLALLRDRASA